MGSFPIRGNGISSLWSRQCVTTMPSEFDGMWEADCFDTKPLCLSCDMKLKKYWYLLIKKIQISFTLYPAARSRQREPRTHRSPLSADFWRYCVLGGGTQCRAVVSTPERRKENINLNKYYIYLSGNRAHNRRVSFTPLCLWATTASNHYHYHIIIVLCILHSGPQHIPTLW